ncbi:MAG: hypothetical protein GY753_02870 [Gammaproteobacteria bacterium]|nr:hypothetical protein [Gammaproteobacteria bacterium]
MQEELSTDDNSGIIINADPIPEPLDGTIVDDLAPIEGPIIWDSPFAPDALNNSMSIFPLPEEQGMMINEHSPYWESLKPHRGKTRTNGLSGKKKRYYEWDFTHGDIEEYDRNGDHRGTVDPDTGIRTKPPVKGRRITP